MIHLRKTEETSEIQNKNNSQIQQNKVEEESKQKNVHIILEKNFARFVNTKAIH